MNRPHLHACSVPGCGAVIPRHMLMCRGHWRRVPEQLASDVWAAWDAYQSGELSVSDLRDVQERATDAVVAKIAAKKGGVQ